MLQRTKQARKKPLKSNVSNPAKEVMKEATTVLRHLSERGKENVRPSPHPQLERQAKTKTPDEHLGDRSEN